MIPADQGLPCGFNEGWPVVVKSHVKKFGDSLCGRIRQTISVLTSGFLLV